MWVKLKPSSFSSCPRRHLWNLLVVDLLEGTPRQMTSTAKDRICKVSMLSLATVASQDGLLLWKIRSSSPWSYREYHGMSCLRRSRKKGDILSWCLVRVLSCILAAVEQHTLCELWQRYTASRATTVPTTACNIFCRPGLAGALT